jgi:hypothetical protein
MASVSASRVSSRSAPMRLRQRVIELRLSGSWCWKTARPEGPEVGVLDPGGADRLVGETLHVLEDVQSRHQPGGQARPADLVDEGLAAGRIQLRPVNAPAQLQQFVSRGEDRLEGLAEHVGLCGGVGLGGAHRSVSIRLQASESDPEPAGNPSRAGARGFARFRHGSPRNLAKPNTCAEPIST